VNKCQLALAIKCSRDTIAKWIAGKRFPTIPLLLRMCQYLYNDQWEQPYLTFSVLIEQDKTLSDNTK